MIMGDAIIRDFRLGIDPLIFTKPLSRAQYLFGRFFGNFLVLICSIATYPLTLLALQAFHPSQMVVLPFKGLPYFTHFFFFVVITQLAFAAVFFMGDLNSRRGRVQGMDSRGKNQVVKAQVPMAEMLNYQSTLNSITAARGSFHMQFSHYDPVPGQLAQKIVQQARDEGRIRGEEEE